MAHLHTHQDTTLFYPSPSSPSSDLHSSVHQLYTHPLSSRYIPRHLDLYPKQTTRSSQGASNMSFRTKRKSNSHNYNLPYPTHSKNITPHRSPYDDPNDMDEFVWHDYQSESIRHRYVHLTIYNSRLCPSLG